MRALVQPADRDAVVLQEDPTVGMGGVPAPPLRVPSRQNVRPGQQKRRKVRKILAYEGILRSGRQRAAGRVRMAVKAGEAVDAGAVREAYNAQADAGLRRRQQPSRPHRGAWPRKRGPRQA